jgi:fermentation-respiration switch protein FrsA (DUF1100 family)
MTLRGTVVAIALGLTLGLTLLWVGQRRLIYLPFSAVGPRASVGLARAEDVEFTTADGVLLHGWFVPAASSPALFTMIMFNGNAGNRSMRAQLAATLASHNVATLLFDYRGYGDNDGSPSEEGLAQDARAARAYLTTRTDVDTSRVVYFGESLGAAVALRLATETPPYALVLRSPFTSLTDIGRHHYPFLPVRWMLRDRYPSIDRVQSVLYPILVIAGDRDTIIPIEHSRRLYDAIVTEKRLVVIPGADHNDEALFGGPRLVREVLDFVGSVGQR